MPNPIIPSLKWLLQAFCCLGVSIVGSIYIPIEFCWDDGYTALNLPQRVAYYYFSMQLKKFFYYNPFSFTTGAIIASGLGYNGVKEQEIKGKKVEEHRWDKIISVYIWELETSTSPIDMLRYWNHQVHLWLKFYIYERLITPGQKPKGYENMATFIVSAFWHGFYPFYYIMFFIAALLSEVAKDLYKARAVFSFVPAAIAPLVANLVSMVAMDYCGTLMCAFTWENGSKFMKNTYACIPVAIVLVLAYSRGTGLVKRAQKL